MTWPELEFMKLLEELGILYELQKVVRLKIFDFYLPNYNMLVEVDGDYWHGNPKKYKIFSDKQNKRKILDKRHNTYLKNNNWIVLRFWEDDIINNIDYCIQVIKSSI